MIIKIVMSTMNTECHKTQWKHLDTQFILTMTPASCDSNTSLSVRSKMDSWLFSTSNWAGLMLSVCKNILTTLTKYSFTWSANKSKQIVIQMQVEWWYPKIWTKTAINRTIKTVKTCENYLSPAPVDIECDGQQPPVNGLRQLEWAQFWVGC